MPNGNSAAKSDRDERDAPSRALSDTDDDIDDDGDGGDPPKRVQI
jgi:hypothetical protein